MPKTSACFNWYRYYKNLAGQPNNEKLDGTQQRAVKDKTGPGSKYWSTLQGGTEQTVVKRFLLYVRTKRHQKAGKKGNVTAGVNEEDVVSNRRILLTLSDGTTL